MLVCNCLLQHVHRCMLNAMFCGFPLSTADDKLEMVHKSKQIEVDESKKVVDGGKESESENEKPALTSNSEVIMTEVKPEEDTVKAEVGMPEPASGKDGDLHSNKETTEGQKQEETKSKGEK